MSTVRLSVSAFVLAASLVIVSAPGASSATNTSSGLRGVVTKGPTSPVCRAETPCSAPAADLVIAFVRGGSTRRVTTGPDGRYRVLLVPGTYQVRIPGARFGFTPRTALVLAGRFAVRSFSIDTGIR